MPSKSASSIGPAVSVVIPVFNRRHLLPRALASVAAQTYRDFELIVVDDGSTDSPSDALEACGIQNVSLIRHGENRGAAAARNSGIRAARGEWIAFLDSDDSWEPEKLAIQVTSAVQSSRQIVASCTGYYLHRRGNVLQICPKMQPGDFAAQILWGCNISPGSTLLIHRRVLEKVGLFDETLRRLEDWDWLLRFSRHYDIAFVQDLLANVYVEPARSQNGSNIRQDPVMQAISQIKKKHLPLVRELGRVPAAKFRSSLYTESAARMHNLHRTFTAVLYIAAALFSYPIRNTGFFLSLWRALWRPLR